MKLTLAVTLLALVGATLAAPSTSKVTFALQKALQTKSRLNIFVSLEDTKATLASVDVQSLTDHGDRATAVYVALKAHADASQKSVLEMLNSPHFFALHIKSFWITNQIYVSGADATVVSALAAMDEVVSIDEEIIVELDDPVHYDDPTINAEWGVAKIRSEEAWAAGATGSGAIVGIIDTGARHTHEALRGNFRAGTHSWYDPYLFSQNPRDGQGHGTHVTGTIAGALGIGVAPGALWISCKGLNDQGSGTQNALISCGEFMACPHGYLGGNPDCSLAPHVVSNSWGGATGAQTFYDNVIASWHRANIIPVFAAGNSGAACSTIGSPSDSRSKALAVGATDSNDAIATFSSRGPSTHAQEHKPDISAPGVSVRSAGITNDNAYATMSGTSMACPHTAGLVALLKGLNKDADFDTIRRTLQSTASKDLSFGTQTCAGVGEREFPNFTFGHGRIDALAAVQSFLKSK
jgi:subtilisin family serine protease